MIRTRKFLAYFIKNLTICIKNQQFAARIEQLKTEVKLKHENSGTVPRPPPAQP